MKKIIELINKLTPANDKLAHYFWGDIYSTIGLIFALMGSIFTSSVLLALLPFIFAAVPAYLKERRDGKGHGSKEIADFVYTVVSSIPKAVGVLLSVLLS